MPNPKEKDNGSGVPKKIEPKKLIPDDSAYEAWPWRGEFAVSGDTKRVDDLIQGKIEHTEPEDTELKDEWSDLPDIRGRKRKPRPTP